MDCLIHWIFPHFPGHGFWFLVGALWVQLCVYGKDLRTKVDLLDNRSSSTSCLLGASRVRGTVACLSLCMFYLKSPQQQCGAQKVNNIYRTLALYESKHVPRMVRSIFTISFNPQKTTLWDRYYNDPISLMRRLRLREGEKFVQGHKLGSRGAGIQTQAVWYQRPLA